MNVMEIRRKNQSYPSINTHDDIVLSYFNDHPGLLFNKVAT